MFLVIPNGDKPRRVMIFAGILWLVSNLIMPGFSNQVDINRWMMSFPALALPYAFLVAWYIPGKDINDWIGIAASWAAWYATGLAFWFALVDDAKEYSINTHLFPCIGYGLLLLVASLPVYCIAYLIVHFIRTFPLPIIQCRHCTYDLTGNESGICPECGQTIDFADQQILKKQKNKAVHE